MGEGAESTSREDYAYEGSGESILVAGDFGEFAKVRAG